MKRKNEIIFWFDSPPKVGKGAFNYVANHWEEDVCYVFNNDFRAERKAVNWNDGDWGKAQAIALYEQEDEAGFLERFFQAHAEAIHIVNGFTSIIMRKIEKHVRRPGVRLMVFSERPDLMGKAAEKLLRSVYFKMKYTRIQRRFSPYVSAFLPLGMLGVKTFGKYGWAREKMFPFMYNPQMQPVESPRGTAVKSPVRFLYVGRFLYKTKGVDVLMKSVEGLSGEWKLDMVGGYGKNAEEVKLWIEGQPRVAYLGRWSANDVLRNMATYDVVVVPSRYDGWNLLVNEALHAGIGAIASNGAVSDEIVSKSGAGMVVKAGSVRELRRAMQRAIDRPEEVEAWKKKAVAFCPKIAVPAVGGYLVNIINYVFYQEGERPVCPWL